MMAQQPQSHSQIKLHATNYLIHTLARLYRILVSLRQFSEGAGVERAPKPRYGLGLSVGDNFVPKCGLRSMPKSWLICKKIDRIALLSPAPDRNISCSHIQNMSFIRWNFGICSSSCWLYKSDLIDSKLYHSTLMQFFRKKCLASELL